MKNLLYLFLVTSLFLTSCSRSDRASTNTESDVLVLKVSKTYLEDGSTESDIITYNGKKIVRATSSTGGYSLFTYVGDLISKIETFNANNTLSQRQTFSYNSNGLLVSSITLDFEFSKEFQENYVYNTDGTIAVSGFQGDLGSQVNANRNSVVTLVNGEVSTYVNTNSITAETSTTTYIFDTKNSPFKNVIGFDKLKFINFEDIQGAHNVLSQSYTSPTINYVINRVYTYNSLNYPILETETRTGSPNSNVTTQYIYN